MVRNVCNSMACHVRCMASILTGTVISRDIHMESEEDTNDIVVNVNTRWQCAHVNLIFDE